VDRSQAAEFLLSCVLPAEQAAAVTGDFVEEFEGRGEFWFWSSVLRTVAARVASDFVRRPFSMLRIAIAGLLRILAMVPVFALVAAQFAHYGYRSAPQWVTGIGILVWLVRCGMWLARRYQPGSALASCIAVVLLEWIWALIVYTTSPLSRTDLVMGCVYNVLLISGGLWARYRDVRQTWRVARA
jgi:hypothetical protein